MAKEGKTVVVATPKFKKVKKADIESCMKESTYDEVFKMARLVVRRLYDAQKVRISNGNRLAKLKATAGISDEKTELMMQTATAIERASEKEYERVLKTLLPRWNVWNEFLEPLRGMGPRLAGSLWINIRTASRFDNVAKLWAYSGLHVINGKAARRQKGITSNWNSELKTTVFKVSESFVKTSSPYRDIYNLRKKYIRERELAKGSTIWGYNMSTKKWAVDEVKDGVTPETEADWITLTDDPNAKHKPVWTVGRLHMMALRKVGTLFLSHLWEVWRKCEGLPAGKPYAMQWLNHQDYIRPEHMLQRQEELKSREALDTDLPWNVTYENDKTWDEMIQTPKVG